MSNGISCKSIDRHISRDCGICRFVSVISTILINKNSSYHQNEMTGKHLVFGKKNVNWGRFNKCKSD